MRLERKKSNVLLVPGIAGVAIFPALQTLLSVTGRGSDATDCALGALIGASAGLLLVAMWCGRRAVPGGSDGGCAG